ncbi:MAG: hypothetical protein KJO07_13175 [Deltaproteobacteria bacterium]|nr:hypothetical protein [Deltaproteobacteria bacterium]
MLSLRRLSLVALFVALGCGDIVQAGGDAGTGGDGGPQDAGTGDPCEADELAIDDFQECFTASWCGAIECLFGEGPAVCRDRDAQELEYARRWLDLVRAGTALYDPAAASACLANLRDSCRTGEVVDVIAPVNDFPFVSEACGLMFVGLFEDGQPCINSEQCGLSGYCERDSDSCSDQCCSAVCSFSQQPLFAECQGQSTCDPGLVCVQNSDLGISTCQTGTNGSPCTDNRECRFDHFCELGGGDVGTCVSDVGENGGCVSDAQCPAPLRCVGDDGPVGSGTCQRADQQGQPCDIDAEVDEFGANADCVGDLYCDAIPGELGACEPYPGDGEDCAGSRDRCAAGFYCRDSDDVCVPLGGSGATCDNNPPFSCQPGLICMDATLTCQAPFEAGANCEEDLECASGICAKPDGPSQGVCEDFATCYP